MWVNLFGDNRDLLDHRAMQAMRDAVGAAVFDEIFDDALFEIAERLDRIDDLIAAGDLGRAGRVAHDLVAVAGSIGLSAISLVSAGLEAACRDGDVATATILAGRLSPIGRDSLLAARDFGEARERRAAGA